MKGRVYVGLGGRSRYEAQRPTRRKHLTSPNKRLQEHGLAPGQARDVFQIIRERQRVPKWSIIGIGGGETH